MLNNLPISASVEQKLRKKIYKKKRETYQDQPTRKTRLKIAKYAIYKILTAFCTRPSTRKNSIFTILWQNLFSKKKTNCNDETLVNIWFFFFIVGTTTEQTIDFPYQFFVLRHLINKLMRYDKNISICVFFFFFLSFVNWQLNLLYLRQVNFFKIRYKRTAFLALIWNFLLYDKHKNAEVNK